MFLSMFHVPIYSIRGGLKYIATSDPGHRPFPAPLASAGTFQRRRRPGEGSGSNFSGVAGAGWQVQSSRACGQATAASAGRCASHPRRLRNPVTVQTLITAARLRTADAARRPPGKAAMSKPPGPGLGRAGYLRSKRVAVPLIRPIDQRAPPPLHKRANAGLRPALGHVRLGRMPRPTADIFAVVRVSPGGCIRLVCGGWEA